MYYDVPPIQAASELRTIKKAPCYASLTLPLIQLLIILFRGYP